MRCEDLEAHVERCYNEIATAKDKASALSTTITKLQENKKYLQDHLQELTCINEELRQQLLLIEKERDSLRYQYSKSVQKCERMERELSLARSGHEKSVGPSHRISVQLDIASSPDSESCLSSIAANPLSLEQELESFLNDMSEDDEGFELECVPSSARNKTFKKTRNHTISTQNLEKHRPVGEIQCAKCNGQPSPKEMPRSRSTKGLRQSGRTNRLCHGVDLNALHGCAVGQVPVRIMAIICQVLPRSRNSSKYLLTDQGRHDKTSVSVLFDDSAKGVPVSAQSGDCFILRHFEVDFDHRGIPFVYNTTDSRWCLQDVEGRIEYSDDAPYANDEEIECMRSLQSWHKEVNFSSWMES